MGNMGDGRKVLIMHYRVGKTDGVSLEIGAWKEILMKGGWQVFLAAGKNSVGADVVIEHFENQLDEEVARLDNEAFGGLKSMTETELEAGLKTMIDFMMGEFSAAIDQIQPDRIIVSNVLAVGENLAAAVALSRVLAAKKIPTVLVHHDFYWENVRYRKPSCWVVKAFVDEALPPAASYLKHVCINTIARGKLERRKGIRADILYDTLDFDRVNGDHDGACRNLLKTYGITSDNIVVLQATRIVRRKNIELAMDVAGEMGRRSRRKVVLVMAGYAEKRDEAYQKQLREYAKGVGITVVELDGLVSHFNGDGQGKCDLLGMYPYADVVTYPSEYEGFGNQFLEAVYARKPVIVWEYPVFKSDIKPLGFKVISLGDKLIRGRNDGLVKAEPEAIQKAAAEALAIINDEKMRREMTEKNFDLGRANFSYAKAGSKWEELLTTGAEP
jgi:mannosylglucosylglycerate synthase